MRIPSRITLIATISLLASCGPDGLALMEDMRCEVETHRAIADERMAAFAAVVAAIQERSDLTPSAIVREDGPPLDVVHLDDSREGNAGLVSLAHLSSSEYELTYDPLSLSAHWLTHSRAALEGEYLDSFYPEDPEASLEDVRAPFLRLEAMRYLVVLKESRLILPSIVELAPGPPKGTDDEEGASGEPKIGLQATMLSGSYRGTALVFDLEGPRLLGIVPVEATNTSRLLEPRGVMEMAIDDLRASLLRDLRGKLAKAER